MASDVDGLGACTFCTWFRYFNSPDDPGGSRAYEFARRWAAVGHRVTLLAGNLNHKTLSTITSPTIAPDGVRRGESQDV